MKKIKIHITKPKDVEVKVRVYLPKKYAEGIIFDSVDSKHSKCNSSLKK